MTIKNEYSLEVRHIDDLKGFGVFSCEDIKVGSVIETCYCLKTFNNPTHPNFDYLFHHKEKNFGYLPFGFGSIYNHSDNPNMIWELKSENFNIIKFISIKEIKSGDELCHNYGPMYWKHREKKLL